MKSENEALWREVVKMRHKHSSQQEIVDRLMKFLIAFANQRAHNSTSAPNCDGNENRLIKRTLLAIDSSSSLKRAKLNETEPNSSDPVRMMAKLEQQLFQPSSLPGSPNFCAQPEADTPTADSNNRRKSFGGQILSQYSQEDDSGIESNQTQQPADQYFMENFILNARATKSTPTIDDVTHESANCASTMMRNSSSTHPINFGATSSPMPLIDMIDSPSCSSSQQIQHSTSNNQNLSSSYDPPLNTYVYTPGDASPSIVNHLNFTQRELDDLKSVLSSNEYNLDTKDLDDLFGAETEDNNIIDNNMYPNVSSQQLDTIEKLGGNEILGNEVQLYKPPYSLLDNPSEKSFDFSKSSKSNGQSSGSDLNTPIFSPPPPQFIVNTGKSAMESCGLFSDNVTPASTAFVPNPNIDDSSKYSVNNACENAEQSSPKQTALDNAGKDGPKISIVNIDGKTQRIIVVKRK
nr:heat shock factor, isoform A [Diamesa zernyi]